MLAFGVTIAVPPLNAFLPAAYADSTTLSLGAIGMAFAIGRVWDGVVDPLIGLFCDRFNSRWGRHKPLVLASALTIPGALLLVLRPDEAHAFVWLTGSLILLYTAYSFWHIPYYAWGAALSRDYEGRSRVSAIRESFTLAAGVAIPLAPLLIIGRDAAPMETLRLFLLISLALLPLLAVATVSLTPRAEHDASRPAAPATFADYLRLFRRSAPLRRTIAGLMFMNLALGCSESILVLMLRDVLHLGDWILILILVRQIAAAIMIPLVVRLASRFQKHVLIVHGLIALAASLATLGATPAGAEAIAFAAFVLGAFVFSTAVVLAPALIADVADYGALKIGAECTAMHYAALSLASKLALAAGPALMLPLIGLTGYEPGSAPAPEMATAFRLLAVGIPVMLALSAGVTFWRFPLDRRRHDIVRRRLQDRTPVATPTRGSSALAAAD